VLLWDTRVGHALRSIYGSHVCGDALAWLPSGAPAPEADEQPPAMPPPQAMRFVTGSWRGTDAVQVWDAVEGKCVGSVPWWDTSADVGSGSPPHGGFVYGLGLSRACGGVTAGAQGVAEGAFIAAGGSGGNEIKVWRTSEAVARSSATAPPPVVGTLTHMPHAVYAVDWTDMQPAVLGGEVEGGEEGAAPTDADPALPRYAVPTLLVAGGGQPLRLYHLLDGQAPGAAAAAAAAAAQAAAAESALAEGILEDEEEEAAEEEAMETMLGHKQPPPEWTWRVGDAPPPSAPVGVSSLPPRPPKAADRGPASASAATPADGGAAPAHTAHALRRGSAALRAVMDARLLGLAAAEEQAAAAADSESQDAALVQEYGGEEEEEEEAGEEEGEAEEGAAPSSFPLS